MFRVCNNNNYYYYSNTAPCFDCYRGENKSCGWIFKPVPDPNRCVFCWIFNSDLKVNMQPYHCMSGREAVAFHMLIKLNCKESYDEPVMLLVDSCSHRCNGIAKLPLY